VFGYISRVVMSTWHDQNAGYQFSARWMSKWSTRNAYVWSESERTSGLDLREIWRKLPARM